MSAKQRAYAPIAPEQCPCAPLIQVPTFNTRSGTYGHSEMETIYSAVQSNHEWRYIATTNKTIETNYRLYYCKWCLVEKRVWITEDV